MKANEKLSFSHFLTSIAQPIWFDANICLLAFQVIRWACRVLRASFMRLIRCCVILAIVDTVTNLSLRNAATVEASKLSIGTRRILTIHLIRTIFAVVLVIALP